MRDTYDSHLMGNIVFRASLDPLIFQKFGHFGYSVRPGSRGHKYSARSCRLLFKLALHHGVDNLIIIVDSENAASLRICEYLGFHLDEEFEAYHNLQKVRRKKYSFKLSTALPDRETMKFVFEEKDVTSPIVETAENTDIVECTGRFQSETI